MAPAGAGGTRQQDKGLGDNVSDIWELVRAYAKQETIDPLKSIGRFLAWGIPGAVLTSLGLLFGALALLRALQAETGAHLTGSWTWVPYLATFVVAILLAALFAWAVTRPFRKDGTR